MKKIVSLLLCTGLCVGLSFCFAAGNTYEEAVAELRGHSLYRDETIYESELCTVFSYSISGTSHGTYSHLVLVYKAGSPLGEGTVLPLPLIAKNDWMVTISPDEIELNEDGTVLTYRYYLDTSLYSRGRIPSLYDRNWISGSESFPYEAGIYTYTVDLITGEWTATHDIEPPSPSGQTYEEAVAELRGDGHYNSNSEWTYETEDCTIFVYDNGGGMRAPHNRIAIIYKPGSRPGDGVCLEQEYPYALMLVHGPDRLDISEDRKTLTYAYLLEEDEEPPVSLKAGVYTYTVDLPAGVTSFDYSPLTCEAVADVLAHGADHTLEKRLDGPLGDLILRWSDCVSPDQEGNELRDYELYRVPREGDSIFQQLLLPSTAKTDTAYSPTHRPPDSIALSDDGGTLTYVYSFDSPLVSGDEVLHEAGTYTYTVDLATGELTVDHTDQLPSQPDSGFADVPAGSWFETGVTTCAEKGVMVGTGGDAFSPERELSQAECLTLAFRLYDLMRGQEHVIEKAPEAEGKMSLTLADGTVFEGYGQGHGEENCVFRWWFSPMGTRGGLYAMVPGWQENQDKDMANRAKAQQVWMDAHPAVCQHDVPATLTLNGATYQGTTDCFMPVGPFVFLFNPEEKTAQEVNAILYDAVSQKAAPVPWWQDTAYTITQRGLEDIFDPADFSSAPASRGFFAKLIAAACKGCLDQINIVMAIPDLPWENDGTMADDYREAAYTLYEAGILTGVDSAGSFAADNTLTRAEAAVMVARALDETQRVTLPPVQDGVEKQVWPLKTERFDTYDQAVADLRGGWGYRNEQTFETPDCTIFVYDPGGIMQRSYGVITLIYKPGSQMGEGTVITLPHARVQYTMVGRPADTMTLSEDGRIFTYTYYRPEDIVGNIPGENEGEVLERAGCVTYTVDLSTGSITERFDPPNYESALAHVSRKRIITPGEHSEDREVVQTLEAPDCTAVLTKGRYGDEYDDYILSLVYKPGSALGDGTIKQLLLPTTAVVSASSAYNPTHRAPDSLFLSAGGTKLVYAYDFTDQLTSGETVYHETGRYTYTVELKTGELSVDAPFKPDNIGVAYGSYQQAMDGLKNGQYPLSVDRQLETESCSLFMGHVSAPHGGYYALKLVFKAGSQPGDGMVVNLPQPRINFWDNGSVPDRLEISEDQRFLTYTYHFDEPFQFDGGIFHEAGDYTYTVDLRTGVVAEELLPGDYGEVLARCLQDEGYTVEQTLEGPFCTALLRYSHVDGNGLAHQREGRKDYEITLVYKAGTDLPEGTLRSPRVPYTFSGRTADGLAVYVVSDQVPDSMAFDQDGKQFIYTYHFDAPLYDPMGELVHEAGTYVYTVDVPTGVSALDIQPH